VTAMDSVCWYENLRVFPDTDTKGFNGCTGQAKFQKNFVMTTPIFATYPQMRLSSFGKAIQDQVIGAYPSQYQSNCGKFLDDPKAATSVNEGDVLNDQGNEYPFKAFAYCFMNTLRQTHGDGAIDAVKNEVTHVKKNWMATALDRQNEFRARHGVEPLQLVKELNDAAQSWADENAKECKSYHSDRTSASRQYNGADTGENLHAQGGEDENSIAALEAADGWYQEIKYYPFPEGFQGGNLFGKIGHFTQTVWKDSKYVGYGYAYNPNCQPYKGYVVARYFPGGNVDGSFPANVEPPKDS